MENGVFETATLKSEGFIHCCLPGQLEAVIGRYYSQLSEILILYLEETELSAPVKYEMSPAVHEYYPHVYGPIELGAVKKMNNRLL